MWPKVMKCDVWFVSDFAIYSEATAGIALLLSEAADRSLRFNGEPTKKSNSISIHTKSDPSDERYGRMPQPSQHSKRIIAGPTDRVRSRMNEMIICVFFFVLLSLIRALRLCR